MRCDLKQYSYVYNVLQPFFINQSDQPYLTPLCYFHDVRNIHTLLNRTG